MPLIALSESLSPGVLYFKGYRIKNRRLLSPDALFNKSEWVEVDKDTIEKLEDAGYKFVEFSPPMN